MKFRNFILQFCGLIWGEFEFFQVAARHDVGVVVAQFALHQVTAEQGVRHKRTR